MTHIQLFLAESGGACFVGEPGTPQNVNILIKFLVELCPQIGIQGNETHIYYTGLPQKSKTAISIPFNRI